MVFLFQLFSIYILINNFSNKIEKTADGEDIIFPLKDSVDDNSVHGDHYHFHKTVEG